MHVITDNTGLRIIVNTDAINDMLILLGDRLMFVKRWGNGSWVFGGKERRGVPSGVFRTLFWVWRCLHWTNRGWFVWSHWEGANRFSSSLIGGFIGGPIFNFGGNRRETFIGGSEWIGNRRRRLRVIVRREVMVRVRIRWMFRSKRWRSDLTLGWFIMGLISFSQSRGTSFLKKRLLQIRMNRRGHFNLS